MHDDKDSNCHQRRELLTQLKCLISSMERKNPSEWDEPPNSATNCKVPPQVPSKLCCVPLKTCKSFELRASSMYRCECVKRNGLQDRCVMLDCMGRPECTTKLYPTCGPGRLALLKLTDMGDAGALLKKFYSADKARAEALAAFCKLQSNVSYPPCCM